MSNHLFKRCSHCGKSKSIMEFYKNRHNVDGLDNWCKICASKSKRKYYQEHKEEIIKKNHKRYFANLGESRRRQRERYKKKMQDPKFRIKHREYQRKWVKDNKKKYSGYQKKWREKVKMIVFIHYGGDPPKCACCGETHIEFLTIDHIDGKGTKYGKGGKFRTNTEFFVWLIKNNFPEKNLRILCYNCNCSIGHYGYCPHDRL